jgi:hypothetical protein
VTNVLQDRWLMLGGLPALGAPYSAENSADINAYYEYVMCAQDRYLGSLLVLNMLTNRWTRKPRTKRRRRRLRGRITQLLRK